MASTREDVRKQIMGPAIGIMAAGGIGAAVALISLGMNALGAGMDYSSYGPWAESALFTSMTTGVIAILWNLLSLAVSAFLVYAGAQMLQVRQHTLCLAGSVAAMVPFVACCCIGLPFGVWGLVVLVRPETKAHFD